MASTPTTRLVLALVSGAVTLIRPETLDHERVGAGGPARSSYYQPTAAAPSAPGALPATTAIDASTATLSSSETIPDPLEPFPVTPWSGATRSPRPAALPAPAQRHGLLPAVTTASASAVRAVPAAVPVSGIPTRIVGGSPATTPSPSAEPVLPPPPSPLLPDEARTVPPPGLLDVTPPSVAITAPTDGAVVGQSPVTITGTIDDPTIAQAQVNGQPAPLTNGAFNLDVPLTPGPNLVTARAQDVAGNVGTASITVTFQEEPYPPAIIAPVDGATNLRTTPTIFVSAFDSPVPAVTQKDVEVQLATDDGFATTVWQSVVGLGSGMAVMVGEESGTFPNPALLPSGGKALEPNTAYFVRARRQDAAGRWSDYSPVVPFTTVPAYGTAGGGRSWYLSQNGDDANPGTQALPWGTLDYALGRMAEGDELLLVPGIHLRFTPPYADFTKAPNRIRIAGADPAALPILRLSGPLPKNGAVDSAIWADLSGKADLLLEDLILESPSPAVAEDGDYFRLKLAGTTRLTLRRVALKNGIMLEGAADPAQPGSTDLLVEGVEALNPFPRVRPDYPGYVDRPQRLTMQDVRLDRYDVGLDLTAAAHVLLEDVILTRHSTQAIRAMGHHEAWTIRRATMDSNAGAGIGFNDPTSSIQHLSIESSTWTDPLIIADPGNDPSTIGTLVLRNNIGLLGAYTVSDCALAQCGQLLDPQDRVEIDYNIWYHPLDTVPYLTSLAATYARRAAPTYEDYLDASLMDLHSPFQTYQDVQGNLHEDAVDPLIVSLNVGPSGLAAMDERDMQGLSNLYLKSGSPAIDAGAPFSAVYENGRLVPPDPANNILTDIGARQFDGTPPVISDVRLTSIGPRSATIDWTTSEPATSQVAYRRAGLSAYTLTTMDPTLTTTHSVTLTGLSRSTEYEAHVLSQDAATNLALSSPDITFRTRQGVGRGGPGN